MDKQLSHLMYQLHTAKKEEQDKKNDRISIENEIANMLPGSDEGTVSDKDSQYKVTVTRKFNRTLDLDAYEENKTDINPDLDPIDLVPSLNMAKLRAIESANPTLFAICQRFITVRPAKVSVSVKEIKE